MSLCAEYLAWVFLVWQSLQQCQDPAPGRESHVSLPRHIWFLSILSTPHCIPCGICVDMLYWAILGYIGLYWYIQLVCVDPCISMAETGECKRNARNQSPLTARKGRCSASALSGIHWEVWWKSRNHLSFWFLCSLQFVFLSYRSTRVFSGQEGSCFCRSPALVHCYSGLLALGSY